MTQQGWDVTVVERAAALRDGGQAVDFRGPVHREVLERMGLWQAICAHRTKGSDMVLLARSGSPITTLSSVMMSGDVELQRGELCKLLYERTVRTAEYRFGDHLTALDQGADDVTVRFASGRIERYGLVVGADGLHSGVRALAFGDESSFLRHHGYRIATYSLPNVHGLDGTAFTYTVPGRACMVTFAAAGRQRLRLRGDRARLRRWLHGRRERSGQLRRVRPRLRRRRVLGRCVPAAVARRRPERTRGPAGARR
jgi:2-polyprenyl-6-methoxyphenol hydroxylase-like FAD-dependent oxidoreductase